MPEQDRKPRQFSVAALFGAVLACSIIFAILASAETNYHISFPCTTVPENDNALTSWFREQDGLTNVNVTRYGNTVHVHYTKKEVIASFDFPMPPLTDMGYDITGFGSEMSGPSLISATLNWMSGNKYIVWILAALAIAGLALTYRFRSQQTDTQGTASTETHDA